MKTLHKEALEKVATKLRNELDPADIWENYESLARDAITAYTSHMQQGQEGLVEALKEIDRLLLFFTSAFPLAAPEDNIIRFAFSLEEANNLQRARKIIKQALIKAGASESKWQPIETAPKDGCEILAITGRRQIVIIKWEDNQWRNNYYGHREARWHYGEDFIAGWQPLPQPPKAGE